ncbi:hypothetical protein F5Y17DRAFT_288369 [Xylariaceae sp. FL0594]|nr:hypothetical protein F5Y17DRAFT_288369 [Xylariaceae sp. FL0594]
MATTTPRDVFGTVHYQTQSSLLSMMPVEMVLDIIDQTGSVSDAASLALTCKTLFSVLANYVERLDKQSKEVPSTTPEKDTS